MKIKEVVYSILDLAQNISDDASLNEAHILFLLDKYRALFLTQYYKNNRAVMPSNMQTLCVEMAPVVEPLPCVPHFTLKSKVKIPGFLSISKPTVLLYNGMPSKHFIFTTLQRLMTAGRQSFQKQFIYCAVGPDGYLYMNSSNPQAEHLVNIQLQGVFENVKEAAQLACNYDCDYMDSDYPIEESIGVQVITGVLKEILGAQFRPQDSVNDAADNMATMFEYFRRALRPETLKAIQETE